jgi:prepilin-type N-terminal cleavage/methylation domain-containing protein
MHDEAGYSLVEMMIVVGITSVLAGAAVFQIGQSRPAALGDGAMRVVLSQMNAARERAITERRQMRLTFTNNTVTILREEIPGPTLTSLSAVPFEGGVQFLTVTGVGDIPSPDNIGNSTAIVFPTATGTPPEVKFSSEGTFINQDGIPLNGTIFVGLQNQRVSARAVSIFGATGRIRAYRFNGRDWKPV